MNHIKYSLLIVFSTMDSTDISGLILLSSWFVVIVLYALRMGRLRVNYHKADQHTSTLAKSAFFVSETAVTLCWLVLSVLLISTKLSSMQEHRASSSFLISACIFSTGALAWPIVIDDYSNAHISFPDWEDVALFTTAVGAAGMSGVAWHNRSGSQSSMFVVGLSTYMAFHYIMIDLIGWMYIRRTIALKKKREAIAIELISQEWEPTGSNTSARFA